MPILVINEVLYKNLKFHVHRPSDGHLMRELIPKLKWPIFVGCT